MSFDYDDDHGPPDSPEGDSERDHVWADLARSEQEPPPNREKCCGIIYEHGAFSQQLPCHDCPDA